MKLKVSYVAVVEIEVPDGYKFMVDLSPKVSKSTESEYWRWYYGGTLLNQRFKKTLPNFARIERVYDSETNTLLYEY